jgi:alpha-beta hydrolase superfamily lysophospholipase
MNETTFEGVGGLKIAARSWQPAGKPRAVMVLIHGFNAHSGYMKWPGEQFAGTGFAV